MTQKVHVDDIRTWFSTAMSQMYRKEVPQYGTLVDLVHDVNESVLAANPTLKKMMAVSGELERIDVERHGAIRVGTAKELFNIRRLFAVMGMYPVGYYDLSVAGLPVHSTAFRPIDADSLARNPFRVFTSLLRLEMLDDVDLAKEAESILSQRQIITDKALKLINRAEKNQGLSKPEAKEFVQEALETFRWHSEATVTKAIYERLKNAHALVADIVSFRGPHINHLTPRTLDIDEVQVQMPQRGMDPKAIIEGPPRRETNILLRQTSFKALSEKILFAGDKAEGAHTARFGEIEQRGMALTVKGRTLYDQILINVHNHSTDKSSDEYYENLQAEFSKFPDDYDLLRENNLAFFYYYTLDSLPMSNAANSIEELIAEGKLLFKPQTYEDFLPVSAAGIFRSNLGSDTKSEYALGGNQEVFEKALGVNVENEMDLYTHVEQSSLRSALRQLNQQHLIET